MFSRKKIKRIITVLVVVVFIVIIFSWLFTKDFTTDNTPIYGVTFSKKYALDLELDWKKTYLAILNELKVSNIRLVAYWDEIENIQDSFDFNDLDWQLEQAKAKGVEVILVVGRRAPRWPECHDPAWLGQLAPLAVQYQQLELVK